MVIMSHAGAAALVSVAIFSRRSLLGSVPCKNSKYSPRQFDHGRVPENQGEPQGLKP
jgi:hypothetical protein